MILEDASSVRPFSKRLEALGIISSKCLWRTLTVIVAGLMVMTSAPTTGAADSASLDGSWRGSGWIKFDSGKRERARCRAFYSRVSPNEFALRANCATKSAKATQTARVHRTGKSRYAGSFFNKEFGVSGSIYVRVKGRSQFVRLTGTGASATFKLRK